MMIIALEQCYCHIARHLPTHARASLLVKKVNCYLHSSLPLIIIQYRSLIYESNSRCSADQQVSNLLLHTTGTLSVHTKIMNHNHNANIHVCQLYDHKSLIHTHLSRLLLSIFSKTRIFKPPSLALISFKGFKQILITRCHCQGDI